MAVVCPACRRINEDKADRCGGCGAPLAAGTAKRTGQTVSMFGSAPTQLDVKPLKTASSTVSTPYAASATSSAAKGDREETLSEEAHVPCRRPLDESGTDTVRAGGTRPKKPWE